MKTILIIGAGLSSSTLIKYLLDHSEEYDWQVRIADKSEQTAKQKTEGHPRATAIAFDIFNEQQANEEIKQSDIVVSMLPARFHHIVAEKCIKYEKYMLTASYVSDEIKELESEAQKKGLLFLNEIGVDPGIDHMSAMQIIDRIKDQGGKITAFKSFTGGLVAPKYDNNPWNYKFTWNQRNVVLAGQGSSAQYIENNKLKFIPYNRLFKNTFRTNIEGYGEFEGYPNRDSLKYRPIYKLENVPTLLRGTLRRPGYSRAWDAFVQLGMTDDSFTIENCNQMTYREFTESFLPENKDLSTEAKTAKLLGFNPEGERMYKLRWLGLFDDIQIELESGSPAKILQEILAKKWVLDTDDKDMIAMQHIFEYEIEGDKKRLTSSMAIEGDDTVHTAMSKTVGLPAAIAVKMILSGVINLTGVVVPILPEIYEPVLKELETYGVKFIEKEEKLT
jgi:saccharopine dehydrogenase-like NADP-dependent oxidoreductase